MLNNYTVNNSLKGRASRNIVRVGEPVLENFMEPISFILSLAIIVTATMVISVFNPVHSVFWLVLSFLSSALLFVQIGLDFIALLFIIVYVGAIAVLFLFVIMMLQVNSNEMKIPTLYEFIPLGVLLVSLLLFKLVSSLSYLEFTTSSVINEPFQVLTLNNITSVATILYTNFQSVFILLSLILLVALIGAILLTHSLSLEVKRQSSFVQIARATT